VAGEQCGSLWCPHAKCKLFCMLQFTVLFCTGLLRHCVLQPLRWFANQSWFMLTLLIPFLFIQLLLRRGTPLLKVPEQW